MIQKLFATAAAGLLLAGCASVPPPDVATHVDQFTGVRTDIIPANLLESPEPIREMVWLNASRVFKNFRDFDYYLEVHYEALEGAGLLNINPGPSLVIEADGREFKLSSSGSLNARRHKGNVVSEDALYEVGPNELRAIANAKKVTVKIIGANGVVVRNFAPVNFERFRKFVHHFVDGKA